MRTSTIFLIFIFSILPAFTQAGEIPNEINWIWLGSNLSEEYRGLLLKTLRNTDGATPILWIDSSFLNEGENSSISDFCRAHQIRLMDLNFEKGALLAADVHLYNALIAFGEINHALLSDLLRYAILEQHGGAYIDTDNSIRAPFRIPRQKNLDLPIFVDSEKTIDGAFVNNDFIIDAPGGLFMRKMRQRAREKIALALLSIDSVFDLTSNSLRRIVMNVLESVGPVALSEVITSETGETTTDGLKARFPGHFMDPTPFTERRDHNWYRHGVSNFNQRLRDYQTAVRGNQQLSQDFFLRVNAFKLAERLVAKLLRDFNGEQNQMPLYDKWYKCVENLYDYRLKQECQFTDKFSEILSIILVSKKKSYVKIVLDIFRESFGKIVPVAIERLLYLSLHQHGFLSKEEEEAIHSYLCQYCGLCELTEPRSGEPNPLLHEPSERESQEIFPSLAADAELTQYERDILSRILQEVERNNGTLDIAWLNSFPTRLIAVLLAWGVHKVRQPFFEP
jgi:hypothetical protein